MHHCRGWHSHASASQSQHTHLTIVQERIHILRKWPQDIPRSLLALGMRSWLVTQRTATPHDGLQPLPHDRDCPQANPVLRGWVRDSHHPVGGYLPSYLDVGALLQKSKLQKVNAESKSLLACHLLRLLYTLYGHLSVSPPQFSKIWSYVMYYTRNGSDTICDVPDLKKDG
jgi:hypothetical protein